MKIIYFIFPFLVTATTCVKCVKTYVFYAKVNGTLKALHDGKPIGLRQYMYWGDSSIEPTEVRYEDGHGRTVIPSNPSDTIVSDFNGFFFQRFDRSPILDLDDRLRLKNPFFYSCEESNGLSIILTRKQYPQCIHVEIYFLPYNKTSKAPVSSYIPDEDVERIPHVFFIKGKKGLEPLYSKILKKNYYDFNLFNHGNSAVKPLEFYVLENGALTEEGGPSSGYAGFDGVNFGFGGDHSQRNLSFGEKGKLISRRFFSCRDAGDSDRLIVINPFPRKNCYEVDMYLLPYNRTSRRPVEGSYMSKEIRGMNSSSNSSDYTYVFFIKDNTTMVPLLYHTGKNKWRSSKDGTFYHPKSSIIKPVEFTLKHKIAYTENKHISGFAGFSMHKLVFGGLTVQTPINLDNDMKIKDHRFYSCAQFENSSTRDIILDLYLGNTCLQVEIYFLPYNRTSQRPVEGSYVPDKVNERTNSSSGLK